MKAKYINNTIVYENVNDLDLEETLECGQCFRWFKTDDGGYRGIAFSKSVTVYMENKDLVIKGAKEEDIKLWSDYFDLDLDYGKIRRALSQKHPILKEAAKYCPGIRILKQDPFEALITFVISQNNNIKRIGTIVNTLCENFGEKIGDGMYAFPTPKRLAELEPEDLSVIRAGFRNRYIVDAARWINDKRIVLDDLRNIPYNEAQSILMQITGVGQKVADCELLYGLHRLDGFPMDVWMKRAMTTLFDDMDPKEFGEYGGIAQQYIFHYSRMHKDLWTSDKD